MSRHHRAIPWRAAARLRRFVFIRDGYRCVRCKRAGRLECDHVIPLDRGGAPMDPENCQTLCVRCHIEKSRRESGVEIQPDRIAWRAFMRGF